MYAYRRDDNYTFIVLFRLWWGVWVVGCAANGITSAFAWLLQNSRKLSINMRGPTRKMNETGKFFAISHWLIFMCSTAHTIQCPVPSNVQFCAPHNGSIIIINYHFVGIASAASQKNRAITTETTTISIAGISSSISPHPFFGPPQHHHPSRSHTATLLAHSNGQILF